jgi:hypothetical protein
LCILKSPESLPGGSFFGPFGVCFSGNRRSSEWDSLDPGILISRTSLPHAWSSCTLLFLFVFSVLYTKNVLKRAQFSRYSTNFFDHFTVPQNWVKTEVLVCPVYTLYEFIVLDNSKRLLYFPVASWIVLIIHTSLVVPRLHHYVTIPPERWFLFFHVLAFPF